MGYLCYLSQQFLFSVLLCSQLLLYYLGCFGFFCSGWAKFTLCKLFYIVWTIRLFCGCLRYMGFVCQLGFFGYSNWLYNVQLNAVACCTLIPLDDRCWTEWEFLQRNCISTCLTKLRYSCGRLLCCVKAGTIVQCVQKINPLLFSCITLTNLNKFRTL